jgi:DNA-directed RNA polymerase specialized sigma24 family protein
MAIVSLCHIQGPLGNRSLFEHYRKISARHDKLPLRYERKLIARSKKGHVEAQQELLLHMIGFFLFRICTTLYPSIVEQYGEDVLQECLLLAARKIHSYRLRCRRSSAPFAPVHLSTYMWKSATGLMLTHVRRKREVCFSDLSQSTLRKIE